MCGNAILWCVCIYILLKRGFVTWIKKQHALLKHSSNLWYYPDVFSLFSKLIANIKNILSLTYEWGKYHVNSLFNTKLKILQKGKINDNNSWMLYRIAGYFVESNFRVLIDIQFPWVKLLFFDQYCSNSTHYNKSSWVKYLWKALYHEKHEN